MTNEEISTAAVNALMDKIAAMVVKGKPDTGLTEDEHAIAMAHAVIEIVSTQPAGSDGSIDLQAAKRAVSVAIRAIKNGSQMRQVAEKRGILKVPAKGDKTADVFSQYA